MPRRELVLSRPKELGGEFSGKGAVAEECGKIVCHPIAGVGLVDVDMVEVSKRIVKRDIERGAANQPREQRHLRRCLWAGGEELLADFQWMPPDVEPGDGAVQLDAVRFKRSETRRIRPFARPDPLHV